MAEANYQNYWNPVLACDFLREVLSKKNEIFFREIARYFCEMRCFSRNNKIFLRNNKIFSRNNEIGFREITRYVSRNNKMQRKISGYIFFSLTPLCFRTLGRVILKIWGRVVCVWPVWCGFTCKNQSTNCQLVVVQSETGDCNGTAGLLVSSRKYLFPLVSHFTATWCHCFAEAHSST